MFVFPVVRSTGRVNLNLNLNLNFTLNFNFNLAAAGLPVRQHQARLLPAVQRDHRHQGRPALQPQAPDHGGQEGPQGDPGAWLFCAVFGDGQPFGARWAESFKDSGEVVACWLFLKLWHRCSLPTGLRCVSRCSAFVPGLTESCHVCHEASSEVFPCCCRHV